MFHEPVLLTEAVDLLISNKSGLYIDGTLGGGTHAQAILERLEPQGKLIGIDLDAEALEVAERNLQRFKTRFVARQGNFRELDSILRDMRMPKIDGILLDLGISSHQIDTAERGFSFDKKANLDMRMNREQKITAYDIVNFYSEKELSELLKKYGEERKHRGIARAILKARERSPIRTTIELKEVASTVLPFQHRAKSFARIFQALRIAVNDELDNLSGVLISALNFLVTGGRIVIIAFHSLEDRLVKEFFKSQSERCVCPPELPVCICGEKGRLKILTKRPVRASAAEIERNPRSRSAKLRAAEVIS